ncbi:MAG: outer membrane protein assembly factor BamD [Candidatus Omnitrophica bacterium]|nr:outer membrane protein assembly factor BamD [Candidatus Omnitrophota bacterium]
MKRCCIWVILISLWLGSVGFAPGAVQVYSKAVEFAKAGQEHFAFMHYNKLLRNYPASKYREQALFAIGEYYFRVSGFQDAATAFKTFLDEYPDSKERLYALAYLLSIAQRDQNVLFVQGLEKQIIDLQQVSFVFRETKEIAYRSPLDQSYKAVIHIDKIEFYVEGELFAKVSY